MMKIPHALRTGFGNSLAAGMLTAVVLAGLNCSDPVGRAPPRSGSIGGLRLLFRVAIPGASNTFIPVTDGVRLYADVDRRIEAFDLNTGERLWSHARPVGGPSALVPRGGRLFFAGDTAVALDVATGQELWRRPLDSYAGFCESDGDGEAFYFGDREHRFYALRATDGVLLWSRDLGPDWTFGGVIRGVAVSGDTLFVTAEHHTGINAHVGIAELFAIDRRTGDILWRYSEGDGSDLRVFNSPPRVAGNLLLLTNYRRNSFIAVDRTSGQEVWRVPGDPTAFGMEEPPEVSNGVAYGASHDLNAKAIELQTGRVIWTARLPSGTPYIQICGTRLLTNSHRLGVFDAATGAFLTEYPGTNGDTFLTDFSVAGNRAYVFSDEALYAFECPT